MDLDAAAAERLEGGGLEDCGVVGVAVSGETRVYLVRGYLRELLGLLVLAALADRVQPRTVDVDCLLQIDLILGDTEPPVGFIQFLIPEQILRMILLRQRRIMRFLGPLLQHNL